MNYFIAYTVMSEGVNLFYNTVLEVDKSVETIADIENMEDIITKNLNSLIKENIEAGTLQGIKGVKIISFKEIEKRNDLKLNEAVGEGKTTIKANRKKTKAPNEIFDTEARRLNRMVLKMLNKY
jgi:hypothetical protein